MTILLLGDLTGRSRVALRMLTYELEARGHEVLALPTALISNTLNLGQAAMLALCLAMKPTAADARNASRMARSPMNISCRRAYTRAGMTPAEPQVGAVTMTPPEAFSSAVAKA